MQRLNEDVKDCQDGNKLVQEKQETLQKSVSPIIEWFKSAIGFGNERKSSAVGDHLPPKMTDYYAKPAASGSCGSVGYGLSARGRLPGQSSEESLSPHGLGPSTLLDVPSGNSSPVHISSSQHSKLNIDDRQLADMTVKELAGLIIDSGYTPTGEEYKKFNDKKILLGICRRLRGD
eukprot:jgi/Tetstr1/447776/TSEL_035106.t1